MGLHLCYRLTLPGHTTADEVRVTLGALQQFATTVGFDKVLGPTEYTSEEIAEAGPHDFVTIVASILCAEPPDFYGTPSGEPCAFAFVILPGKECEAAIFGFIAPGARSDAGGSDDDLHPGEWFWSGACKTQYASLVSDEHLVKCHLGLVRVLEHASTLGIAVTVDDETGYWEHRSTDQLLDAVRDMNGLVARFAGAVHDQLGAEHRVEAPIFDHPDFEHLEMQRLGGVDQADGADEP
jgi:hypothetical protein